MNSHPIKAKRPRSIWKTPIKVNVLSLATALTKGILDAATMNATGAAADLEKILTSVGFDGGPSELLWRLVVRAMVRGLTDLLRQHLPFSEHATSPDMAMLQVGLEQVIDEGVRNVL